MSPTQSLTSLRFAAEVMERVSPLAVTGSISAPTAAASYSMLETYCMYIPITIRL
jgi:hypothetical protein